MNMFNGCQGRRASFSGAAADRPAPKPPIGLRSILLGSAALMPSAMLLAAASPAAAAVPTFVSVCTGLGVTLPTAATVGQATDGVLGGVVDTALNPVINNINAGMQAALSGQTLNVGVIDPSTHSLATPAACNVTANELQVTAPGGISLGGGMISGLGSPSTLAAGAVDPTSIALGNGASTPTGVTNAVALGTGAVSSAANSVALGANATALRGALTGYTAFGLAGAQTAAGEVSVGATGAERQLTHVAAGSAATDAATLGQLQGTAGALGTGLVAALGAGSYNASTGQLTAPSFTVGGNAFGSVGGAITALDAAVTSVATGLPLQYSTVATPLTPQVGAVSNDVTLVGAAAGGVRLHNLAGGVLASDATTLGQVQGLVAPVATLARQAVGYVVDAGGNLTPAVDLTRNANLPAGTTQVALTGLSAGALTAGSADAVNGAQLGATGSAVAAALGGGAAFNTLTGQVSLPSFALLGSTYSTVGTAFGAVNTALMALQAGTGVGAVVSTNLAQAAAPAATGANALAGGFGASASGLASTVVGNGASDNGTANAAVFGNGARIASGVPGSNVALGQGSVAALGSLPTYAAFGLSVPQTSAGEVAVGAVGAARQITHVAAGAAPTDAVNVAQLRGTSDTLGAGLVAALGAGHYDTATGQITAPSFTVGGASLGSVSGAIAALDTAVTTAAATAPLQYSTSGTPTVPHSGVVSNDVTLVGAAAGGVALHNLAAGTLATDAATVGQVAAGSQSLATALGGGAAYDAATGQVAHPTYAVQGSTYATVGGALNALQAAVGGVGNTAYFETNSSQPNAQATAVNAIAVGPQAVASAASAVAIGQSAVSSGLNSVALGAGSTDGGQSNVVSVGAVGAERRVTNVLRGTLSADSTDAVTGAQLFETNQAMVQNTQATLANAGDITALQTGATGLFRADNTTGDALPLASGSNAVAGGFGAVASAAGATAIGHAVQATSAGATAIGSGAIASGDPTTAVGTYSQATGNEASAFGAYAAASADNATALGRSAAASAVGGTAVGFQAQSTGLNSVALGAGSSDGGVANVVSVGDVGAERRITNVAAGTLSASSTDAVNGSQLYSTNAQLASLGHAALHYDTDASGNTTSSVTLASDEGGPVVIHNLAPGVEAGDAATVGQVQAAANASVQYKMVNGLKTNVVALAGGAAGPVTISNVAAGVAATDAVNVAQLQATGAGSLAESNAYTDARVNNLAAFTEGQIKQVRDESIGGTALALAATGLRYDDRPGKISIGGSASVYRDQMGLAFGIGGTTEDGRYRLNASITADPTADKPTVGAVFGLSMALN